MRTLPQTFIDHARDGTPFIWLVDIFPTGADTWSQFRWAERAVTVDGNAYEGGFLQSIDNIRNTVRIFGGGGVATRDSVSIHLLDRTKELHRLIQQLDLEGRDVQVSLAMMPLNLVRNGSFESSVGDDFNHWTETNGDASNIVNRSVIGMPFGSQWARLICNATPGPKIQSASFKVRAESTLSASFYAAGAAAGDPLNVQILCNSLYWNDATRRWQVSAASKAFSLTTTATRYTIEGIYDRLPTWNSEDLDVYIVFELPTAGHIVYIDGVQIEARARASSYHGSRYDMTAADLYPVYWGEVRTPKWDRGVITIGTKSIMNRRHRDIPVTKLTENTDASWVIPPDNIGKPFPMTYGNFLIDDVNFQKLYPKRTAAAGLVVNSVGAVRVYFDRPGVALGTGGTLYHFSGDSMRFFREYLNTDSGGASEWTGLSTDAYREATSGAKWLRQGLFRINPLLFAFEIDSSQGDHADWTNPGNLADDDLGTYAEITLTSVTNKSLYARIQKPQELAGLKAIKAYILSKCQTILNSGTAVREIRVNIGASGALDSVVPTTTGLFDNIPNGISWDSDEQALELDVASYPEVSQWLDSEIDYYVVARISSGATPNVTFRVYALGLRVDCAIDLADAVICKSLLGRTFGDTWGGRKTSASVIFKPVDVIEGILRHELGIVTGEINTASFDAANSEYGSRGSVAGQVVDIQDSVSVIEQLCECTGLLYYVDGAGKEAIRCLKHGAPDAVLHPHDFVDNKIDMEFLPREEIVTDFTLHWGYVPGADVYLGHTFCNRSDSNIGDSSYETKCAAAYASLGNRENPREYECRWINTEADAQSLLKWLITWTAGRRRIAKTSGFLDQLNLEFGDRADLRLQDYLTERDTDPTRPVFIPYELTIRKTDSEARVDISYLEVLAP